MITKVIGLCAESDRDSFGELFLFAVFGLNKKYNIHWNAQDSIPPEGQKFEKQCCFFNGRISL